MLACAALARAGRADSALLRQLRGFFAARRPFGAARRNSQAGLASLRDTDIAWELKRLGGRLTLEGRRRGVPPARFGHRTYSGRVLC